MVISIHAENNIRQNSVSSPDLNKGTILSWIKCTLEKPMADIILKGAKLNVLPQYQKQGKDVYQTLPLLFNTALSILAHPKGQNITSTTTTTTTTIKFKTHKLRKKNSKLSLVTDSMYVENHIEIKRMKANTRTHTII